MKIAILTSGGDAPGMNACLSNLVTILEKMNHHCYVFDFGYQGIIENKIRKVAAAELQNISHLGGSVLKSFRSLEFKSDQGIKTALSHLKENEIDVLITLGGDGTFRGASVLVKNGINVIGIPCTIDNDLFYTDRTLGFDTAVNNAVDIIDKIKQTMAALNRVSIIEVMGRGCADIAVYCAVATNATTAILSEKYNYRQVLETIQKAIRKGEDSPCVIVRENLLDVFELTKKLQNDLDLEVRPNIIGYAQRGGSPTVFDRIYAKQLSYEAARLIASKTYGVALGMLDNEMIHVPLSESGKINNRKKTGLYEYIY